MLIDIQYCTDIQKLLSLIKQRPILIGHCNNIKICAAILYKSGYKGILYNTKVDDCKIGKAKLLDSFAESYKTLPKYNTTDDEQYDSKPGLIYILVGKKYQKNVSVSTSKNKTTDYLQIAWEKSPEGLKCKTQNVQCLI